MADSAFVEYWNEPGAGCKPPCESEECYSCAANECPDRDPLHRHHDECPSCYKKEIEGIKWRYYAVFGSCKQMKTKLVMSAKTEEKLDKKLKKRYTPFIDTLLHKEKEDSVFFYSHMLQEEAEDLKVKIVKVYILGRPISSNSERDFEERWFMDYNDTLNCVECSLHIYVIKAPKTVILSAISCALIPIIAH